jgi:YggT family protein
VPGSEQCTNPSVASEAGVRSSSAASQSARGQMWRITTPPSQGVTTGTIRTGVGPGAVPRTGHSGVMLASPTDTILLVVYYVLFVFYLFIIGRLVVEVVRGFARDWRPAGGTAVSLELMYRVTDPPVKLLKKLIPAIRIGNISLDLSMMILLIVVYIVMRIIDPRGGT